VAASWVGLAALAFLATSGGAGRPGRRRRPNAEGEPPPSSEELASHLSLPARDLERALHPLLAQGLLRETPGRGYVLGRDPAKLRVEEVFDAYEHRARRSVEHIGADLRDRLERWVELLASIRAERLGPLTLAELLAAPDGACATGGMDPSGGVAASGETEATSEASIAHEPALTGTAEKQ
jgi:DNA-binding IscR family transcriptional regulator